MTNLSGANLNNGAAVGSQGEGRESPSKFTAYPAYKDSGVEWLGDVPEGWSVASIRFFADLITGITPPSDDLSNYAEEGWSWVRPEDLDDSGKPVLASKFLTDQGWSFCRKVKGQSTLICCIGTIGKLGFIETDACTNQQITAVVPRQGGRFYFYAMHALKPAFDACATGNVLRILNSERLGSVEIAVPSKSETESIARFLDHETGRIDALIEEQQRLIKLLKEKRQAVISHAVTKGLDPTVPMKNSGVEWLGEVPRHWRVCKLSFRYSVELGKMLDEKKNTGTNPLPYLRNQDVQWGSINIDGLPLIDIEPSEYERYTVRLGDLLVCEGGDVGRAAIWRHKGNRIGYQKALHRLRPESPSRDTAEFFFFSLMAAKVLGVFEESDTKATISHLPAEKFRQYRFAFPPIEDQQEIASVLGEKLKRSSETISYAENTITLLQERRSALISAAVTGKIDVRGWQPPARAQAPVLEAEAV